MTRFEASWLGLKHMQGIWFFGRCVIVEPFTFLACHQSVILYLILNIGLARYLLNFFELSSDSLSECHQFSRESLRHLNENELTGLR
jgi:hypothetical protein